MITVGLGRPVEGWQGREDEWHFVVAEGKWLTDDEMRERGVLQ